MQASVRPPAVQNFYISIWIDYLVGAPIYIALAFVGWWAYGTNITPNLLINNGFNGPNWALTIAYIAAFLQIIVSLHVS